MFPLEQIFKNYKMLNNVTQQIQPSIKWFYYLINCNQTTLRSLRVVQVLILLYILLHKALISLFYIHIYTHTFIVTYLSHCRILIFLNTVHTYPIKHSAMLCCCRWVLTRHRLFNSDCRILSILCVCNSVATFNFKRD